MRRSNSKLRAWSWLSVLALAATARGEGEWLRHFRIGGSVGMNVSTEFKTSGTFSIDPAPPSARGGITYDDGFVGVDEFGNTGDLTRFWGYNDASQFNDATDRLTFHGTRSFTGSGSNEVSDNPLGLDMVYAGTFRQWERAAIGAEFGFGMNIFQTRDRRPMAATLNQRVDQYDASGVDPFPTAPYVGTESGAGSTDPLISDVPIPQADITVPGTIGGYRSLEGILYSFRIGPLFRWQFYPQWTLNGSAGGAFGIFDAEYRFNESISATATSSINNRGKFGTTDLTYGGYAGAVVMYDTGNYWEAYLGAHFMSLQDGKIEQGGREARMYLGAAVYLTAGINWSF